MEASPVSNFWSDEARRISWTLITFSRRGLKLAISPTVATSFVFLHLFYNDPYHEDADLYLLLISSLFLSCKIEDSYRPLGFIFREFFKCVLEVQKKTGKKKLESIIGKRDFTDPEVTDKEAELICHYEITFLNLIEWDMDIDIPFKHINEIFGLSKDESTNDEKFYNIVLRNLCLIQRNENYLKLPPLISAAVSILCAFGGKSCPEEVENYILKLKQQYPSEFELAHSILKAEFGQCIPCV